MSYDEENKQTDAAVTAALAVASMDVKFANIDEESEPFVIVPDGYRVENLEHTLANPARLSGTTKVRDAAAFAMVVNADKSEATRLYRTVEPPQFVAVFNDHSSSGRPGWGDHRAVYDCPKSPEWKAWTGKHKAPMKQSEFAQFIEDNLPDIIDPDGATMLEIAKRLTAKKKVNFTSGLRLDNGEIQFQYEEEIEGRAGPKGQFTVPQTFTLGVSVFENGPRYRVTARFRYRIADGGELVLWYDLERAHKIIEDAVDELRLQIENETGLKSINGFRED